MFKECFKDVFSFKIYIFFYKVKCKLRYNVLTVIFWDVLGKSLS